MLDFNKAFEWYNEVYKKSQTNRQKLVNKGGEVQFKCKVFLANLNSNAPNLYKEILQMVIAQILVKILNLI